MSEIRVSYEVIKGADNRINLILSGLEPIPLTPEQAWGLSIELNGVASIAKSREFAENLEAIRAAGGQS